MIHKEHEALVQLQGVADFFLIHNRPIEVRCDDSVVRSVRDVPAPIWIRRSRGYAPESIPLVMRGASSPILATGALLKNTFALAMGGRAVLSHHIGDLNELSTYESYQKEILHYEALFGAHPQCIVHDLHPDYLSTQYARERACRDGVRLLSVQHHHAHMASCMAENKVAEKQKVIGVIWDGTGYGTDGKIWGGEFLIGDYAGFERVAHFCYRPMPGGDQAVREPWRMAASYLLSAGVDPAEHLTPIPTEQLRTLRQMIDRQLNCPQTSSVGRLFDAVAALLRIRSYVSFEGQAAMELEALALRAPALCAQSQTGYSIEMPRLVPGLPQEIDVSPWILAIIEDLRSGVSGPEIANRFHASLVDLIVHQCCALKASHGINRVALSGGVFMNALLLQGAFNKLQNEGFEVLCHKLVPANDGGISLGQLAVGVATLN
jgi:hydrogenase maturation protein HypF